MTYAHRDQIYDADTHLMERPDWIAEFSESATPKVLYDMFAIVLGVALTFLAYNFHEYLSGVRLT